MLITNLELILQNRQSSRIYEELEEYFHEIRQEKYLFYDVSWDSHALPLWNQFLGDRKQKQPRLLRVSPATAMVITSQSTAIYKSQAKLLVYHGFFSRGSVLIRLHYPLLTAAWEVNLDVHVIQDVLTCGRATERNSDCNEVNMYQRDTHSFQQNCFAERSNGKFGLKWFVDERRKHLW